MEGNFLPTSVLEDAIIYCAHGDNSAESTSSHDLDQILSSIRSRSELAVIEGKRRYVCDDESFYGLAKQFSDLKLTRISYDEFKSHSVLAPDLVRRYFSTSNFMFFPRDSLGTISCDEFLRFVQRSIDVEKTCLQLLRYARELNNGFMTECELERYIFELVPDMRGCQMLDPSFYAYYVFTAARRFFFFLDPKRSRRVSIKKLAHSTIMEELMYLQRIASYDREINVGDAIKSNWFSGDNALRVYYKFIRLDRDKNGMLNKDELMAYEGTRAHPVQLTSTAVLRIFEENISYTPVEMDYKTFLDLILALENKTTVESLSYFWRVLDVDQCGRLSPNNIKYFYRDIQFSLRSTGYDATSLENITVEIYDMLACSDQRGPTFEEFVKSGQGHTVISMLLDITGFWHYDNRESLKQPASDDDDDQSEAYVADFEQ